MVHLQKYNQKQANYHIARFSSKSKCKNCIYFMPTKHLCHKVTGLIACNGVCKYHKSNKR